MAKRVSAPKTPNQYVSEYQSRILGMEKPDF